MPRPRTPTKRNLAPSPANVPAPTSLAALIAQYPPRLHRQKAAEVVSQHFFDVSPRTLERWEIPVRLLNGRAYVETRALLEEAQRRVDAAPQIAA
jgi:hypothetical protein